MLQLISATGQQTVDALAFLLAFALTALMDSVFHDKLPHDHGRAFAVNGELSKGKARGSGLIFVLCIALVTLAVVPFKVEYLIYTVLLIASMLSGYFDDASETAWNEYKKGLIDFVIAVVAGVTYLNFNGTSVRRTAAALGMRTEASGRFEKGLDPMNTVAAVDRACELVELLGCGEVMRGTIDVLPEPIVPKTVKLEPDKVNGLLGTDVSEAEMRRILLALGFELDGDTIIVPSWRGDVEHYSDIAEEVARFYGYNNIPDTLSNGLTARRGLTDIQQAENLLGSVCRAAGYDEIITYSFISPTYYDKIDLPKDSPLRDSLKILNPLGEDTSIMRTTTLPSMLEILTRNYNFRNKSAKLYELGRVYFKRADGLADEPKVLTLGAYGDNMDFFTLKGAVEAVLKQLRIENVRFLADSENPSYHPGRCAKVFSGDRLLGVLGQVHPHVAGNYGVDAELYAAELRFDALYESKGAQPVYQPLPKFPAVTRDIAVVCDKAVTVGELEDAILKGAKGLLKDVALFDIYTGVGIAPGKKSVAFNLTLRSDDRSLTAEEADADVKSILTALEQECGAVLR